MCKENSLKMIKIHCAAIRNADLFSYSLHQHFLSVFFFLTLSFNLCLQPLNRRPKCFRAEALRLGWRVCPLLLFGNVTSTSGARCLQRIQAFPINPGSGAGDSPERKQTWSSQTANTE